jgi:hypothetical protein
MKTHYPSLSVAQILEFLQRTHRHLSFVCGGGGGVEDGKEETVWETWT